VDYTVQLQRCERTRLIQRLNDYLQSVLLATGRPTAGDLGLGTAIQRLEHLMSRIFADNAQSIGNTPLVRINRLGPAGVTILAKIEGRNPGYSVKCRIGANMIWDAEQRGVLKPGMTIVEPTSGNTGIGLAYVAAAKGYKLVLTMPASMSLERRKILKALGAELVLTEPPKGMKGAIEKAAEIAASDPGKYFMPQQFDNPANPAIHEKTTGPEIWNDTDGVVDVLVSGVGTGGTITGISRYIKNVLGKPLLSVAVEPVSSPVISQTLAGDEVKPSPHKIQGIGAGFVPKNLDLSMVDRVVQVTDDESKAVALRLMQEEGILCGISCGAAMAAALKLADEPEMQGKTIVVILPDSGERYLSSMLFSDLFSEQELQQ
jgi:cysteine synthase A